MSTVFDPETVCDQVKDAVLALEELLVLSTVTWALAVPEMMATANAAAPRHT
jgi:hypothetical protein